MPKGKLLQLLELRNMSRYPKAIAMSENQLIHRILTTKRFLVYIQGIYANYQFKPKRVIIVFILLSLLEKFFCAYFLRLYKS